MHRFSMTMPAPSLRQFGNILLIRRSAVCMARHPSSGCLTLWETVDGSAPYKHRSPWITRCASKQQRIQSGNAGYLLSPVAIQEVLGTLDNANKVPRSVVEIDLPRQRIAQWPTRCRSTSKHSMKREVDTCVRR